MDGFWNHRLTSLWGFALRSHFCHLLTILLACSSVGLAQQALSSSSSSRAVGLGGADVASPASPLEAMQDNPAGLGFLSGKQAEFGVTTVLGQGDFKNREGAQGELAPFDGVAPFGAFTTRLRKSPTVTVGFSVAPENLMKAAWQYEDPAGTGGASYGRQRNESSILTLRSAVGAGWRVSPRLSVGGTLGAVYNRNSLRAPYVFQEQPQLSGLKALIDLHTAGLGWNGSLGFTFTANDRINLGLSYESPTTVHSRGSLSGNAGAQFAAVGIAFRPDFYYDAEVTTRFPQLLTGGTAIRLNSAMTLNLQGRWAAWSNAFDRLPVNLSNGSNDDINRFLASNQLHDEVPLRWHDQGIFSAGIEDSVTERLTVRAGYSFANDPVPSATVTPLTAAISQNAIGSGIGYRRGRLGWDFAYRYVLPATETADQSTLLAGEYKNSRVDVSLHMLTLTIHIF